MNIEINNRFTDNIIICGEYESIKDCLQKNKGADLRGADLRGADLREANLREADLRGADLWGAKFNVKHMLTYMSVQSILTLIDWKNLSDELTLEMMRHDAESCGIDAMTKWVEGNDCPFSNSVRDYKFTENKNLWIPGTPQLRGMELLKALCEEKKFEI